MSSSFAEAARSLLAKNYSQIHLHHVVALYGSLKFLSSTRAYHKLANKILALLSETSERLIPLIYSGVVPDFLIRFGIRLQLRHHLAILEGEDVQVELEKKQEIVKQLTTMPIAIETDLANEQHYEVPATFYDLCLGPAKKYSSGLWDLPGTTLAESETNMLDLYCQRAELQDGMRIVDLGCGWGSLTLHIAQSYPNAKITAISNSLSQRDYILQTAKSRGYNIDNITVITCNVANDKGALDVVKNNDRVMTVEMFEHMKNYNDLMKKIHGFLKPGAKLFCHIFSHKRYAYHFEEGSWMADNFFTGGTMPSDDLLLYFPQNFAVEQHWRVCGTHYEQTCNAWLKKMDYHYKKGELQSVLKEAYGKDKERKWYVNWRLFYMACAELFGLDNGQEWIVSHYLFSRRS